MKVLVICAEHYNGHELWTSLGILQQEGIEFEVTSQNTRISDEVTGERNTIDRRVWDVTLDEVESFDGLMVVSGNLANTEAYWTDKHVLSLVQEFDERSKPIAAICCSVPTIRFAAKGKKVSFFPLVRSRDLLENAGAVLQCVACTADQNLITAEHQMATQIWAENYCKLLKGEEITLNLTDSGYTPRGRPRRPMPELERLKRGY